MAVIVAVEGGRREVVLVEKEYRQEKVDVGAEKE